MEMAESKKQGQRAVKSGAFAKKDDEKKLPPPGTGRRIGTAKEPTGRDDRLTEEQRKKRHEKKFPK